MKNKANNKVGQIVFNNGDKLLIHEGNKTDDCKKCYFEKIQCQHVLCMAEDRSDNKDVYFVLAE